MLYTIPLSAQGVPTVKWGSYAIDNLPPTPPQGSDVALLCGEINGIIALDIDSDAELPRIMALIDGSETMLAKFGSKGRTIFFRYNGEANKVWKKNGQVICELLSNKRLTTIPPSKHRTTGKSYEWINEGVELVEFPSQVVELLDLLYPQPKREVSVAFPKVDDFDKTTLDEVEEMLSCLSPDCSRDEWISIGMGLRDEFGDCAFSLWDKWSSGSSKYKSKEMWNIWRSFDGQGVGIGTVIYLAQEAGYVKVSTTPVVDLGGFDIDLSYLDKKTASERKQLEAHGLVGMIADWITATAVRPQPQLSLGAALTFVGMLKGHKVETPTGLRANFLAMNIAPTGGGKEHPLDCIEILARHCGVDRHILSEPTAGTSLLKGILDADRIGLWAIDELGRYLGHLANKNAGGYQREILDYVIKSFSKANGVLRGKKFANEKLNPQINIINPHLCIVGASVKERIIENCTSSDAIDGFLNRWILFESLERPRLRKTKQRKTEVSQEIINAVALVKDLNASGGYPAALEDMPLVKTVRYTPEAYAIMESYKETIEDLIDVSDNVLKALYVRSCEHVAKLALILCDNEFMREADVELAIEIVSESNKLIADFAGLIADNQFEADYIKVREIIYKAGKIKRNDLTRKAQSISGGARRRNEILKDLLEAGEIGYEENGKLGYFFKLA